MHPDGLEISAGLVRRLLAAQHPSLADAAIERVPSWGTVNAMFRVGAGAVARMPLTPTAGHPEIEAEILDRLAGRLSARIPAVIAVGLPGEGYPREWLLLDWIDGDTAPIGHGGAGLADDLAVVFADLAAVSATDGPVAYRGGPLRPLDRAVRRCLRDVADEIDERAALDVWRDALGAPPWPRDPVWVHGDLLAGNLLLDEAGRLRAVLDWEAAGLGDPACDLMAAWSVLDAAGRARLRDASRVDGATWRRGRGWALAQAAIALPYYRETNPQMAAHSRHVLAELAAAD